MCARNEGHDEAVVWLAACENLSVNNEVSGGSLVKAYSYEAEATPMPPLGFLALSRSFRHRFSFRLFYLTVGERSADLHSVPSYPGSSEAMP